MRYVSVFILAVVLLCASCVDQDANYVEPALQPYVDAFFEEGRNRNLDISADDFAFTVNFGEQTHLGTCTLPGTDILINNFYWRQFSELEREYLMFHELGHCILGRPHDDQILPNGECKSIMNASGECRENLDNYNIWKTYYLDELFDAAVDLPEWYKTEIQYVEKEVLVEFKDSLRDRISIDIGVIDPDANVIFEAYFSQWDKTRRVVLAWGDQKIGCTSKSVYISDGADDLRYLKKDVVVNADTKISFVRLNGFDHYLLDDQMIHMEELQDNPLQYVRVAIESLGNDIYKAPMSLKVALLE